jgi:hypothetical protein
VLIALVVSVAFFTVLAVLATAALRPLWRNEPGEWQTRSLWWQRLAPTGVIVGWAMLLGGVSTPLALADYPIVSGVFEVLLVVALLVFVAGFALAPWIAFLARPAVLVPPHLRPPS